jgi:GNAT superfamily N-acetyltransferase
MPALRIAPADDAAFDLMVAWARAEGWDLGLGDGAVFRRFDPDGFLMGYIEDVPVASISVVRYGDAFGFLGFYIVHPDHRGRGYGLALWEAGMARLDGLTVGLDGVVAQQANYARSGFVIAHRNGSFAGRPAVEAPADPRLRAVTADDLAAVAAYDRPCFPAPREAFLADWLTATDGRIAIVAIEDGRVAGYGVIRPAERTWRIGPLVADREPVADLLFRALAARTDGEVSLDLTFANPAAVALAERYGLALGFETARMYRGPAPDLAADRIYGITSFELG